MSQRHLHIVLVEPNPSGGLFHFAYQLGTALAGQGHRVELLTGPRPELEAQVTGFSVVATLPTWHGGGGQMPAVVRKLRRATRAVRYIGAWLTVLVHVHRCRPDVVQLAEWRFGIDGFLAAWLARRGWARAVTDLAHSPIPLEERRAGSPYRRGWLLDRGLDAGYRAMDTVIVLGESSRRDQLLRWPHTARVDVISHGDEEVLVAGPLPPPSASPPQSVFFGILTGYKGLDALMDAHALVVARLPSARLLIAGATMPDLDVERLQARAASIPGVSLRLGYVPIPEVAALMGSARLVVAPYRRSNASGIVRLAQTAGRPVVVTAVGDLADSVDDGETGFVVPPGDVSALAAAMLPLLTDIALADRMGAEGRRRLQATAAWPLVGRQLTAIYGELVGGTA
ncbi:MAG: glycosyltransferase family 4 protein [Actinomycetota bacterium]|nr:glycosyltransferase family 4 protein [Actinomycetota bacterium]